MAAHPVDLGRETPDCPGRFHGTYNAAHRGGCVCPGALAIHLDRTRAWRLAERDRRGRTIPRRLDVDPQAVDVAIDGYLDARQLTPAERVEVVAYLARVRRMKDGEIALYLRWGGHAKRPHWAVCQFRVRHGIPAGVPPTHGRPLRAVREAVAA